MGLFSRRERWGLSRRGWLALLAGFLGIGSGVILGVHPFLAVTSRTNADALVVEGWIPEFALRDASEEFRSGGYEVLFTTGGPTRLDYSSLDPSDSYASVSAHRLLKLGMARSKVQMVPSRVSERDRTYSSAIALRQWLGSNHRPVRALNVATLAVHARRTRLMYQKAFDGEVDIGIIALPSRDYDERHWWRYSEGVKEVMSEGAAYLYARLFFWPDPSAHVVAEHAPSVRTQAH